MEAPGIAHVGFGFASLVLGAGVFGLEKGTDLHRAALKRPRKTWLGRHYYCMGWSYVGLWAATASEIVTRVPGLPFWPAVVIPTATVTLIGGALVQLRLQPTLQGIRRVRSQPAQS